MRVRINRDYCDANLAFCEQCLGKFLKEPEGYERHCFEEIEEDGSDILTLEIHSGEHEVVLKLDEEQRKLVAGEGWSYFVNFIPTIYRVKRAG